MFNLIITLISIALVSLLAAIALFYGGAAVLDGDAKSQAAALANQAQQVTTALTLYYQDHNAYPSALSDLVDQKYLSALPTAPGTGTPVSWALVTPGQPVVWAPHAVTQAVCQALNLMLLQTDGIKTAAQPLVEGQCFGEASSFSVLFGGSRMSSPAFVELVTTGAAAIPDTTLKAAADGGSWVVAPTESTGGSTGGSPSTPEVFYVAHFTYVSGEDGPVPVVSGEFQPTCPSGNVITQDSYGPSSSGAGPAPNMWTSPRGLYTWYDFGASPLRWHPTQHLWGEPAPSVEFCLPATPADQALYADAAFAPFKANMLYFETTSWSPGVTFDQVLTPEAEGQVASAADRHGAIFGGNITLNGLRYGIYHFSAYSYNIVDGTDVALFQIKLRQGGAEPITMTYELGWAPGFDGTNEFMLNPANYKPAGTFTFSTADVCTPDWQEQVAGFVRRPDCG